MLLALAVELIVINARVWTGVPERPAAEALAVRGERIAAVGTNAEVRALAGPGTRIIDARGDTLAPGLIDAHAHVFNRPVDLVPLYIEQIKTKPALLKRVAEYAESVPAGAWVLGREVFHCAAPTRLELDNVSAGHPVWLEHESRMFGVANSAALRAAGLVRSDGIVRFAEMALVEDAIAAPMRARDDADLDAQMRRAAENGVTTAHESCLWHEDLPVWRRAHADRRMTLRLRCAMPLNTVPRLKHFIERHGRGDAWLRWDAVKGFPIRDNPLEEKIAAAKAAGVMIRVHISGAEPISELLDIVERQGLQNTRFRLEHAFFTSAASAARMAKLGVIGSLQPAQAFPHRKDAKLFEEHLPSRRMLDAGAVVAFGTDGAPEALRGIQLAVATGAATFEEALAACTRWAAYAAGDEAELGTLEEGKLADLVLFDTDSRVRLTVVGGRVVYERQ